MNALHVIALVVTLPVAAVFFIGGAALAVLDWDR